MRHLSESELAHVTGGDLPVIIVAGPKPNPWIPPVIVISKPQPDPWLPPVIVIGSVVR